MKRLILTFLILLMAMGVVSAQDVNVTFWVNTATVPDTITENANIQLRGDPAPLTWGNDTGAKLTHVSGDYWTTTLAFPTGSNLVFKVFADSENDGETGWEANVGTVSTNREYTVGTSDTTLPLIFYNTVNGRDQWWTPFTSADSIDVLFRVNVAGWIDYNAANHDLTVRGGMSSGAAAPLSWSEGFVLTPEVESQNAGQLNYNPGNFHSGVIQFPAATDTANYQFVVSPKGDPANVVLWENSLPGLDDNRVLALSPTTSDTTLAWKFLGNVAPIIGNNMDTVVVTYSTDVTNAIQDRGFSHGDTLLARAGYFGTSNEAGQSVRLLRQGFSNVYSGTDTVVTTIGSSLDYQYYLVKNAVEIRENYYDFNFDGSPASRAERRRVEVTGSVLMVDDNSDSQVSPRRQPIFPNQATLAQAVLVTWEVDLRPAIYQTMAGDTLNDIQGDFHVSDPDSVLAWGVWINGPAAGGWGNPGGDWGLGLQNNLDKKMYDDGTNGDRVAGDSVFTTQIQATPDSLGVGTLGQVGQVYKFGIYGGDNEGGQGGFGNNHVANIDDSGSEFTIFTQFGSINPAFYSAWNYDEMKPATTGVYQADNMIPDTYELGQNYPNPFNPETTFNYSLPKKTQVSIKVYNLFGQVVATIKNGEQPAGNYTAVWNGRNDRGQLVSSGVYLYKISTDDFTKTLKMSLLK